jgi:hypothetical protein
VEAREGDDEAILNRALIQSRRRSARRYSRTRASGLLQLTRRQPGEARLAVNGPTGTPQVGERAASLAGVDDEAGAHPADWSEHRLTNEQTARPAPVSRHLWAAGSTYSPPGGAPRSDPA